MNKINPLSDTNLNDLLIHIALWLSEVRHGNKIEVSVAEDFLCANYTALIMV